MGKLKIALDVKGTLEGPKGKIIMEAAKIVHDQGHEVFIWSNMLVFAYDFAKKNKLPYQPLSKAMKMDFETEDELFDVAIEDDRQQDYLASKRFIFVDEITDAQALVKTILGE